MRAALVLVSSTLAASCLFANNAALPSPGASATSNACLSYKGVDYLPSNAIDDSLATQWVSPGGTPNPYLLINLGQLFTVDNISITGVGNPGLTTSFDLYVGTSPDVATLESSPPILRVLDQADGAAWSFVVNTVATTIQYVLYAATNSTFGCPGPCYPGNAYFYPNTDIPYAGQEDAFTTGILVDATPVPEPVPAKLALPALMLLLGLIYEVRRIATRRVSTRSPISAAYWPVHR